MAQIAVNSLGLAVFLFHLILSSANNFIDHSVLYRGPAVVHEGYPFTIRCFTNRRDPSFWTIDGVPIPPNNDAGYILSERVLDMFRLEMVLHGDSAQLHHEGEFRCNGYSRDYHHLTVIRADYEDEEEEEEEEEERKAPEMPYSGQILEINDTITLVCTSAKDDDTPVHWYKNGRRIIPHSDSNLQISRKYLIIEDAQEENAGEYMCTVDYPIQTGLTDIGRIFQVKSPVRILDFPSRISVMKGRSLTITCSTHGFPSPKITWYKDNVLVSDLMKEDSRIWVYASGSGQPNANLIQRDVSFKDRGLYTCRAENSLDNGASIQRDEESALVHVRENMIETNEDEPGMGKLLVPGEDLVLQCNTTECPQCIVVWFKDGMPVFNTEDHLTIYDENNSIVIQRATYNDSGIYVCAIDRDQLDIALNATIAVQSEIKLTKFHSSSDVVVQGHPLELFCVAKGAPKPLIKWFKGSEEISSSHKRIKLLDHDGLKNGKLLIEEADYEDRDHYTCEAFNQVNSANTTIFIRVKDKLAALWPFLGICVEVAILCSIIFIYERKKNSEHTEAETDLPAENRATQEQRHPGHELRQRK